LCGLGNFDERDHRIKTAGVQGQWHRWIGKVPA
jgi:hypothetical protein